MVEEDYEKQREEQLIDGNASSALSILEADENGEARDINIIVDDDEEEETDDEAEPELHTL